MIFVIKFKNDFKYREIEFIDKAPDIPFVHKTVGKREFDLGVQYNDNECVYFVNNIKDENCLLCILNIVTENRKQWKNL